MMDAYFKRLKECCTEKVLQQIVSLGVCALMQVSSSYCTSVFFFWFFCLSSFIP